MRAWRACVRGLGGLKWDEWSVCWPLLSPVPWWPIKRLLTYPQTRNRPPAQAGGPAPVLRGRLRLCAPGASSLPLCWGHFREHGTWRGSGSDQGGRRKRVRRPFFLRAYHTHAHRPHNTPRETTQIKHTKFQVRDPLELVVSAYLYHYSTPPDWQVRAFLPFGLAARIYTYAHTLHTYMCMFLPLTRPTQHQSTTHEYIRTTGALAVRGAPPEQLRLHPRRLLLRPGRQEGDVLVRASFPLSAALSRAVCSILPSFARWVDRSATD